MMRRRFLLALPVAAGSLQTLPGRAQSLRWERIAGPNGRYSLEMPGPVRHRSSNRPDGGKRILTARIYYDNERLYEQMALTTPQEQNGPVLTRFMNSLGIAS